MGSIAYITVKFKNIKISKKDMVKKGKKLKGPSTKEEGNHSLYGFIRGEEHGRKLAKKAADEGDYGFAGEIMAFLGEKEQAVGYAKEAAGEGDYSSAGVIMALLGNKGQAMEYAKKAIENYEKTKGKRGRKK